MMTIIDLTISENTNAEENAALVPICLGKVCAPLQREATSQMFYFWHPASALVERGQIVVTNCELGGIQLTHYGIVDEVFRTSRAKSIGQEQDQHDGDVDAEPPFESEGINYARVRVLRVIPDYQAAPRERTRVNLATDDEVIASYSLNDIANPLPVGLVKNGGERLAGVGPLDLDYLLGRFGAHLLVTGAAGRGTKSSFLVHVVYMLLNYARRLAENLPGNENLLRIVPIIFNVKSVDLFFLDRANRDYDPEKHGDEWARLGIEAPGPFSDSTFYAPQESASGATVAVNMGRSENDVQAYSWSLRDVIENESFSYLFADADTNQANFAVLAQSVENWLTTADSQGQPGLNAQAGIDTFQGLLDWVNIQAGLPDTSRAFQNHATGTWRMFYRRLLRMVNEGGGILRRNDQNGNPLNVVRDETTGPIVIDLFTLAGQAQLQRFVVATVMRQLKDSRRIGNPDYRAGVRYLVVLDELNRFAPRNAKDAVTTMIEEIAAQLRSSGIVLLGAQQQASRVSETVVSNAGITVLGKTSAIELADPVWRGLSDSAKRKGENLRNTEKLILQDTCSEPMHVKIPFPAWAMNAEEALLPPLTAQQQEDLNELFGGNQ